MRHTLRRAGGLLLAAALIGCGSNGGNDGPTGNTGNTGDTYAVTATLTGEDLATDQNFRSNDYFANNVGNFAFAFHAADREYTILISIQSAEGEPLPLRSHLIGSDEETRIVTGGSLILETEEGNIVYNAETGGGAVELTELSAFGASGSFLFQAKTLSDGSAIIVGGEFDLTY